MSVVFVGSTVRTTLLENLIAEFLQRDSISCSFSTANDFDADDLFAESSTADVVRVFIRIDLAGLVRLYFRGPGGRQFLLRRMLLPKGLDPVGRELVGQVVESSVAALLHSSEGISPDEASAALNQEQPPASPRHFPKLESRPRQPIPRSLGHYPEAWFGLRYAVTYAGPTIDPGHGPGVEAGLGDAAPWRFRGRASVERYFPQALRTSSVGAHLQTLALRLGVDLRAPLSLATSVVFAFSAGIDRRRIEPFAIQGTAVVLSSAHTDTVPIVRPELRYEWTHNPFTIAVIGFGDLSLFKTEFQWIDSGVPRHLATPLPIRPGASIAAELHWQ